MEKTLSYSEKTKGWTSFHSFIPDFMTKLNNRFFSVKDGQLYLHNDENNPVRNNFYGVQYTSKITTEINDSAADDKIFKNIVLEGDQPWEVSLKTNYTEGTIHKSEFNHRESRWFAHTRKNEIATDYHGQTAQGIGVILSHSGNTITFSSITDMIMIGDVLCQLNGSTEEIIGTITLISGNVITVASIVTTPSNGFYSYVKKNPRVEGSEIRGYYLEVTLEQNDLGDAELFAINTNAVKSYP